MSVTFTVEALHTGEFLLSGACGWDANLPSVDGVTYADHVAAEAALVAHKATCEECAAWGCHLSAVMDVDVDSTSVNLANMNARMILIMLGLDTSEDLCGSASGEDFLARVMLAMAVDRDDTGVAAAVVAGREVGTAGATLIDCGLRAGYYAETLGALHALGTAAATMRREVHWA